MSTPSQIAREDETYVLSHYLSLLIFSSVLGAIAVGIYLKSRGSKVDPNNVNDEWTGTVAPEPESAVAA